MGGITRAVEKAGQQLGIIKKVAQTGGAQIPEASAASAAQPAAAVVQQREKAEEIISKRRVRRGGRALLSEARLNPEVGVGQSTLGSGPM